MRIALIILCSIFSLNSVAQDKGKSLFFGVNVGTKIANKNYALRYSGAYRYYSTNETQLVHIINTPTNYNKIRELLGGVDFEVPYDAYPLNIKYIPGLLTGVTLGYQLSPNLQMSVDGNFNKLKIKEVFTLKIYDGAVGTSQDQIQLGQIYAEESRFDFRYNFDYVTDGNGKAKFIIGGSGLYSFWRMDKHEIIFKNYTMPLFSNFSNVPPSDANVVRGAGWGVGMNIGFEYRVNEKIVSQIMYQPYQSFVNYGFTINKRILLQHDITVRFLWK